MFNKDKLRELREKKGLTVEQLAEFAGCNASFITHLEMGRREPTARILHNLALALECKMDDLYK